MSKLVLTRKAGELVKIGDSLVLTIREVHAKKVYLDIGDTCVWRELGEIVDIHGPRENRGEPCRVPICAINKGVVKLLFEADRSVTIVRSELLT